MKKFTICYSEAFKRQVVGELESGNFPSVRRMQRANGIFGAEAFRRSPWRIFHRSRSLPGMAFRLAPTKPRLKPRRPRQLPCFMGRLGA